MKETGLTIGQFFYHNLLKDHNYSIKQQVFPREAYLEEFDRICIIQQQYYPETLTSDFINKIRNEIIYYQRKLKSQKGLVSVCEFEGFRKKSSKNGQEKEYFIGPKVAPKSSPLSQVCKIWESINNIILKNKNGLTYIIGMDKKNELFQYLNNNEKLTFNELLNILQLSKNDGWYGNKQLVKGLQGNTTTTSIRKCLNNNTFDNLLEFELKIEQFKEDVYLIDQKTGEVLGNNKRKIIIADIERQPLYKLWHVIYSIQDKDECHHVLTQRFNFSDDISEKLSSLDFTKQSFGNKSVKAMRKILPYLMEGFKYSEACSFAGYNHSNSLTKEDNLNRILLEQLPLLPKNSLRQPVVEKILNQMINLVNALVDKYGKPTEIRVELARELKQSKEERNETFAYINKREKENKTITDRIEKEYEIKATRNNISKWRLFHEIDNDESKINATCIYCGKHFGITAALKGEEVDIEHIIPKKLLFDDSQSNKTLSHRTCNSAKGDYTAFDYMKKKSDIEFNNYIERVNKLYKDGLINKSKHDKFLMSEKEIPQDFIDRQLRETQYISKKSREILLQICHNVWATSGSVTEFLRRTWGWDDVLMNIQLPKYRLLGLTEWKETERSGQIHRREVIKDWSKRNDHRHHAIDALVIACTKQGYVQRINTLSSEVTRKEMYNEIENTNYKNGEKRSLLENYLYSQRPFNTKEIEGRTSQILISYKSGKKVATIGKRKVKQNGKKTIVQEGIVIPRGALSEESVYGKIKIIEKNKPLKYLFENPDLIFNPFVKSIINERLTIVENDIKKALSSVKENPIYLDKSKKEKLEHGACFKEEFVIKYPVESLNSKDIDSIVDLKVKNILLERLRLFDNNIKEAFKNIENNPIWYNKEKNISIKTVRCFTGLSSVEPVKKDKDGNDIGFVKPGNNHHLAFYSDENNKIQIHGCTFWHAVERKKYRFPIIIKNPSEVWNIVIRNPDKYPESIISKFPCDKWQFIESFQQNEMFIIGMQSEEVEQAICDNNFKTLSECLYRLQKISYQESGSIDIWFRHQFETQLIDTNEAKMSKRYYRIQSVDSYLKLNPIKVRINNIGEIIYNR